MAAATIAVVGRTPDHTERIIISESNEFRVAPHVGASVNIRVAHATRLDSGDALGNSGIDPDRAADAIVGFAAKFNRGKGKNCLIDVGRQGARDGTDAAAFHASMIVGGRRHRIGGGGLVLDGVIAMVAVSCRVVVVSCGIASRLRRDRRGRGDLCRRAVSPREAAGGERHRHHINQQMPNQATHRAKIARRVSFRQSPDNPFACLATIALMPRI